ncbi:MAG: ABC transporter ATP-binding protein [Bacteroidota bacterium]|nr:ABC transporter ATP-binding protein [Bacteroidota bacterium]
MITISNLEKVYNGKIVLNIKDLVFNEGEIVGLVGNNGAGKTTLLRLMLDLIKADKGVVQSNDYVVSKSENWKDYTASYLDEGFLIDFLTPEEFFCFVGESYGFPKKDIDLRLSKFKNLMNNEVLAQGKKYIRDFSKGNKQKIGIISTLLTDSKVLILDEPFVSLDPTSQILLKRHFSEYNKKNNATMVISSHDLNHISEICNRIILIEKGELIRDLYNNGNVLKELENYFTI